MVPPMVDLQALHCARQRTFGMLGVLPAHIARKYSLQLMANLMLPLPAGTGEEEEAQTKVVRQVHIVMAIGFSFIPL